MTEQANLSPSAAVTLWNGQMQPLGDSVKLVSPAVTNGVGTEDAPLGVPWLQKFLELCTDCQIDAVAVSIDSRLKVLALTFLFAAALVRYSQ